MNPITEAAIIAASSTGVVAIVGYLVNFRTTTRTLGSAATLSQDERLWQRRADVYAEIFAYSGHRREVRGNKLGRWRFDDVTEKKLKADLDAYVQPEWFAFQGRVLAFSSDEVSHAFIAAHDADGQVWTAMQARTEAVSTAAAYPPGGSPVTVGSLSAEITELRQAADRADQALIALVRRELLGRPRTRWWLMQHRVRALPEVPS